MPIKTQRPVARYILASLAFTLPAAWLALYTGCLAFPGPVCELPRVYEITAASVVVWTLLPLGLVYQERARRRAAKGMYGRVSRQGGWAVSFQKTIETIWDEKHRIDWGEGPSEIITGEMRYEARGWWCLVEVNGGRRVWVDRERFWRWLERVEAVQRNAKPGESAIAERCWVGELGRPLWMAYVDILEAIDAVEYPTDDVRSRRYVPGLPWGRVEEFEKLRPSEPR